MEALFEGETVRPDRTARVRRRTSAAATHDIEEAASPTSCEGDALPYFVDWLIENVHLVEITAYSDDDAYTIFETMNDRGLSLSPTDMLKGYLLANIDDAQARPPPTAAGASASASSTTQARTWRPTASRPGCAASTPTKIRERKKGAKPEDFDRIGTEFHRWLRDASEAHRPRTQRDDFYRFIDRDFDFYSRQYLRLVRGRQQHSRPAWSTCSTTPSTASPCSITLLLAPLGRTTPRTVVIRKLRLVAQLSRHPAHLAALELPQHRLLAPCSTPCSSSCATFAATRARCARRTSCTKRLGRRRGDLRQQRPLRACTSRTATSLHRMLARITDYVETPVRPRRRAIIEYVSRAARRATRSSTSGPTIPSATPTSSHHPADFAEHRNRIGGLLLLPKSFNASYGDLPYDEKLPHYNRPEPARPLAATRSATTTTPASSSSWRRAACPSRRTPQFNKADLEAAQRSTARSPSASGIRTTCCVDGHRMIRLLPYPAQGLRHRLARRRAASTGTAALTRAVLCCGTMERSGRGARCFSHVSSETCVVHAIRMTATDGSRMDCGERRPSDYRLVRPDVINTIGSLGLEASIGACSRAPRRNRSCRTSGDP